MTTRSLMITVAATALFIAVIRGPEWMAMLWIWFVHTLIGAVLSAPVVFFGRKRVHWGLFDLTAFLLPFAVWANLMNSSMFSKSLANLGEPFFFSFAIPLAALVRVIAGSHGDERVWSVTLVASLCFTAAAVYCGTPSLPE